MHLLDTNTLTYLHEGHPLVVDRLRQLDDPYVGITIVTKVELLRGRIDFLLKASDGKDLLRAQQLLLRTEALLSEIHTLPFDQAAVEQFERLRTLKSVRKIGRADLLIASITLANRATLVTRNLKDFSRIPQLKLVNWVDL